MLIWLRKFTVKGTTKYLGTVGTRIDRIPHAVPSRTTTYLGRIGTSQCATRRSRAADRIPR